MGLRQTGITLICGGVVGLLIAHTGERSTRLMRSRLLNFFGRISYAFYLIHALVKHGYDHLREPLPEGNTTA